MAPATQPLIASVLGEPAIVSAMIAGAAVLMTRVFPKTRSEAGVDRAQARKSDAESWSLLQRGWEERNKELLGEIAALREEVDALRSRAATAEAEAREAREALGTERDHADEQIRSLIERITSLEAAQGAPPRVWFRE